MEALIDGCRIFYLPTGSEDGYPLFVLHGGPGLDHTMMHPWLDSLSETLRLIYIDLRGQGRSGRVDPSTLTLERYARDISLLAESFGYDQYAVLGHSYGAFITLAHAIEEGTASHYILSSGSASMSASMLEVEANLRAFQPVELRDQVTESWARERRARTAEDVEVLMRMQMPFHFHRIDTENYRRFMDHSRSAVYSPEVLAYTASHEYSLEYEERLASIRQPVLIVVGEHDRTTTPRAAKTLHEGIPHSRLVVIPEAGHMSFVEQPDTYVQSIRAFFADYPLSA